MRPDTITTIREALELAREFINAADDWNFDEAEINGEWIRNTRVFNLIDQAITDLTTQAEPQGAQWTPVPDDSVIMCEAHGEDGAFLMVHGDHIEAFDPFGCGDECAQIMVWPGDNIKLMQRLTPASPAPLTEQERAATATMQDTRTTTGRPAGWYASPAPAEKHITGKLVNLAGTSIPVEVYRLNGQEVVTLDDVLDALEKAHPATEVLPANDHLSTIYKLITEYWSIVGPDEHYLAAKRALLALADATNKHPATEGVTQPDSPGWWAFEGHHLYYNGDTSDLKQTVCKVAEAGEGLYIFGQGFTHSVEETNLVGTWHKLTMPWERPPASPG